LARLFLSYDSRDRDLASGIARRLEAAGHDLWWDRELESGDRFRQVIDRELDAADTVIVIWTPASVRSPWVIAEADNALRLDKLLPLRTADIEYWQIPKPFGTVHTSAVDEAAAIETALAHIAGRRAGAPPATEPVPARQAGSRSLEASVETRILTYVLVSAAVFIAVTAVAAVWVRLNDRVGYQAWLMLALAAVFAVAGATIAYRLSQRSLNPVYEVLLTTTLGSIGVHAALIAAPPFLYGSAIEKYGVTLASGAAIVALYAGLLWFQRRGAAWVLPAGRLLALLQVTGHSGFIVVQFVWAADASAAWWTSVKSFALLHCLYLSVSASAAAIAAAFLIFARRYERRFVRADRVGA